MPEKKINRREALAAGLPHFYTGRPCALGHVALKSTEDGMCEDCRAGAPRVANPVEVEKADGRSRARAGSTSRPRGIDAYREPGRRKGAAPRSLAEYVADKDKKRPKTEAKQKAVMPWSDENPLADRQQPDEIDPGELAPGEELVTGWVIEAVEVYVPMTTRGEAVVRHVERLLTGPDTELVKITESDGSVLWTSQDGLVEDVPMPSPHGPGAPTVAVNRARRLG